MHACTRRHVRVSRCVGRQRHGITASLCVVCTHLKKEPRRSSAIAKYSSRINSSTICGMGQPQEGAMGAYVSSSARKGHLCCRPGGAFQENTLLGTPIGISRTRVLPNMTALHALPAACRIIIQRPSPCDHAARSATLYLCARARLTSTDARPRSQPCDVWQLMWSTMMVDMMALEAASSRFQGCLNLTGASGGGGRRRGSTRQGKAAAPRTAAAMPCRPAAIFGGLLRPPASCR